MSFIESLTMTQPETVENQPWLAPLAAFLGRLLTAANPCVLAMVPLMVDSATGRRT